MKRAKAVLDSSVIIVLSKLNRLGHLTHLFGEIVIPAAVYEEVCIRGRGLPGDRELREAVEKGIITIRNVRNRPLVIELRRELSVGEAEAIVLALEEEASFVILDDKLARERATEMGLNVIGTLRVLRMFYDKGLMDKQTLVSEIRKLRESGFWVSDNIIRQILENRLLKNGNS